MYNFSLLPFRNEENEYQEGNESSKYLQILAFDQESSQAASDALALLTASNSNDMFQMDADIDAEPSNTYEYFLNVF